MKYIKAKWDETRGDEYDNWGTSVWFLELDDENFPLRQIEIYQNGKILKYDSVNFEDKYGMLGDQKMETEDIGTMNGIEINLAQFENKWLADKTL